jgi:hypothetical protein
LWVLTLKGTGELVEAASGKREFGVEVKRGSGQAAEEGWELGAEGELEAELGFAGTTFSHDFGYGVARDASAHAAV